VKIIVAGAGEQGTFISQAFTAQGHDVVLVDRDAEALDAAGETLDVMTMEGDCTYRTTLEAAGASGAAGYLGLTGDDATNLVSAALARTLGAKTTVARVAAPGFYPKRRGVEFGLLGVHATLCEARLASAELENLAMGRHASMMESLGLGALRVGLFPVGKDSPVKGVYPHELHLPEGIRVSGVARVGFLRPPADAPRLEPDDVLMLAGDATQMPAAWPRLCREGDLSRAVVLGGGDVGSQLAEDLAQAFARVELVEMRRDRAEKLAEDLPNIRVLVGDGRHVRFLEDLNLDSAAAVFSTTRDDETNLLIALMARKLGARQTFSLLRRSGYRDAFEHLPIDGFVGTYEVMARCCASIVAKAGIRGTLKIKDTGHRLIEWHWPDGGFEGEDKLRGDDLPIPSGGFVVAHLSDSRCVEEAHSAIHAGDTHLFAIPERDIGRFERAMRRWAKGGSR